jgi:hypothetical protein
MLISLLIIFNIKFGSKQQLHVLLKKGTELPKEVVVGIVVVDCNVDDK